MTTTLTAFSPKQALENFEAFKTFADYFAQSQALPFGIKNAPQLVMVMQAWFDLWLSPTEAMNSLAIINGRVSMYWEKVIERVTSAGYEISFEEKYEEKEIEKKWQKYILRDWYCKATLKKWERSWTEEYSKKDAELAWLLSKDNRLKYPKLMMRYRAVRNWMKFFCPEVMWWTPMYEEMKDFVETPYEIITPQSDALQSFWTLEDQKNNVSEKATEIEVSDKQEEKQQEQAILVEKNLSEFREWDVVVHKLLWEWVCQDNEYLWKVPVLINGTVKTFDTKSLSRK